MTPISCCLAVLIALLAGVVQGHAAGLDDVGDIDIVRVSKDTGQVYLYLVLDPDQSAADAPVLNKVRTKLGAYRYYVTTGQVWKNEKGSNSRLPVVLTVVVTGAMSEAIEASLLGLRPEFQASPTAFAVAHMPRNGSLLQKP